MMSMGNRSADQGTAADGSLPRKRRRNRRRSSGGSTSSNSSSSSCSSTANGHEGKLVVAKSVLSTWVSSAVLIICGLLPFGYIHPDEYFQNPEVVAGPLLASQLQPLMPPQATCLGLMCFDHGSTSHANHVGLLYSRKNYSGFVN